MPLCSTSQVAAVDNVTYGGGYTAEDLPAVYGDVHFSWTMDFMEEGLNSSLLLPNRLYESPRFGAVPIALAEVQVGRYLQAHHFGVRLPHPGALEGVLQRMTPESFAELRRQVEAVPREALVADAAEARDLVRAIADRAPRRGAKDPPARHLEVGAPPYETSGTLPHRSG